MSKYIQKAIKLKKKNLTSQLIKMGVFTKDDKHLYELTLTELEKEVNDAKIYKL